MKIDHILLLVREVDAAAAQFAQRFGLGAAPTAAITDWGMKNRIIALGDQFIELMGIADAGRAAQTPIGQYVANLARREPENRMVLGSVLCLSDIDIEAVAARLDIPIETGNRRLPDGRLISWRHAGAADAMATGLPVFIDYAHPELRLADAPRNAQARLAWAEIATDLDRLKAWLGQDVPPAIKTIAGTTGVMSFGMDQAGAAEVVHLHDFIVEGV